MAGVCVATLSYVYVYLRNRMDVYRYGNCNTASCDA